MTARFPYRAAFALVLAAATVLRLQSAAGDLWLDEIWSLSFVRDATSMGGVLAWHHDNNHLLNSLYLYLLGPDRAPLAYRALSVAAGVLFLLVFWRWPMWRNRREALIAAVLAGSSYLLVLYASEARGYSLMLLFEALAVSLAWSWIKTPAEWKRLLFAVCVLLGLASHLTFALFYAAVLAATISRETLPLHRRAAGVLILFGLAFLRGFAIGGGDPLPWHEAWRQFGLYAAGFPNWPVFASIVMLVAGTELARMWRADRRLFLLSVGVMLLPTAAAGLLGAEFTHPRYFLVGLPFLLLVLARSAESAWAAGGSRQVAAVCFTIAVVVGQAGNLWTLHTAGRGQYRAALSYIRRQTVARPALVGSDHDFRNRLLIDFYSLDAGPAGVLYVRREQWDASPPAWMILHSTSPAAAAASISYADRQYDLERTFTAAPLSGFAWSLYRARTNTTARASW